MDLNTATSAQLQRIPRIGPAIAERIIDYREEVGRFRRIEDITRVRGIGPATFETISPFLFVVDEVPVSAPDTSIQDSKIDTYEPEPMPPRYPGDPRRNPPP
ncbi:hypothetical protein BH23BAC4_BH23BAC4_09550 [soil metagenome]